MARKGKTVAVDTPICDFGWKAPDFMLRNPDGRAWSLNEIRGTNGTLVMFICNHCPYVRAIADRIAHDVCEMQAHGIGAIAIMPNDYAAYPEDAPAKMAAFASRHRFTFPYVIDETQAVAKAFGAVCTPDFFGFDRALGLQYRGRLDDSRTTPRPDAPRELLTAMLEIARTQQGPREQTPSVGCSIKWRAT